MHLRRFAIAGAVFAGAVLAGCTAPPPPTETPAPSKPTLVNTVWKVAADLVGAPRVANGTAVSYFRRDGKLRVGAWRLADGKQLWSAAAVTGAEAPGIELGVDTVTVGGRGFVAYVTSLRGNPWYDLVIADVVTGPSKKRTPTVVWPTTRPIACSDKQAFCMVGYQEKAPKKQANLRIDPPSGAISTDSTDGLPTNARRLAYTLYTSDDRPPEGIEQLGSFRNNATVWERPYTSVFGEGASSDFGWAWQAERDNVIVGVGYKDDCQESIVNGAQILTCEDTNGVLVGLDSTSGATLWSLDRASGCQDHDPLDGSSADRIVICRNLVDSAAYRKKGDSWKLDSYVNEQELVVANRKTGEILWRSPLGKTTGQASATSFVDSEDRMVLVVEGKPTIFDTRAAAATPVPTGAGLFCERNRPTLMLPWLGSDERYDYAIGNDVEPCDLNGRAIQTIPVDWVSVAGVDAGDGRWLLPTPGSLTLVQLS